MLLSNPPPSYQQHVLPRHGVFNRPTEHRSGKQFVPADYPRSEPIECLNEAANRPYFICDWVENSRGSFWRSSIGRSARDR